MLPFCIKQLKNQHRTMSIQQSPSESPGLPCPGQHRAGSGQGTISGEAPAHTTHKGNGDTILPKTVTLQHFLGASQGTSRPVSCSILGHVLPPSMAKLILTLLPPVHMEHHQLPVPVGVLLCVQWARSSCQKKNSSGVTPSNPVARAEHQMVPLNFVSLPDASSEANVQESKRQGPQVSWVIPGLQV